MRLRAMRLAHAVRGLEFMLAHQIGVPCGGWVTARSTVVLVFVGAAGVEDSRARTFSIPFLSGLCRCPMTTCALITYGDVRSLASRQHMSACPTEIGCPVLHQTAPPLEQVRTRVGSFRPVGHHVRQRRFEDFSRMVGFLSGPVPEARPEAVRP